MLGADGRLQPRELGVEGAWPALTSGAEPGWGLARGRAGAGGGGASTEERQ